jgi:autoinducer-2 kinase
MDNSAFCVIDVGTGGVKCLVFDSAGSQLYRETTDIELVIEGLSKSFDPIIVWNNICLMTSRAVKECSKIKKKIVSVSSTSMREGNVFYDRNGVELLAVPNLDERAQREAREIESSFGEGIYLRTGHWPTPIFLVSRLKFLKKHSAIFSRIKTVSMINDWVLFKFSGKIATEPTNGCETAMFSLKERNWSDEIVKDLGFDRSLLPEVEECGTILGQVIETASRKSGLDESTLVVVGAADTESALAGCGLFKSGNAVAVAGTTTPVQSVTDSPLIDGRRRVWSCCHVLPDRWTIESNAGATGLVLKWWSEITGTEFLDLDGEVLRDKPPPGSVQVNVGATVMNAKHPHPVSGGIQGVGSWTPRSHITLGILEANCFSVRGNLDQLESFLGGRFPELYFCGGASSSKLWRKLQAAVLGRMIVSFGAGEATGRGAAMLSAVGVGEFSNLPEASKFFVKTKLITRPDAKLFETYDPHYQNWLKLQKI